ncbi:AraC-type DNA-binding protein [bacterium A37T11]|nr:AraC-type DNA-binding protein [bacterium A37T11]
MNIKSKIEDQDDWLFWEEVPELYNASKPLSEKSIEIRRPPVKELQSYQLSSSGMFVMHTHMQFDEAVKIVFEVEGETITSQFVFYRSVKRIEKKSVAKKIYGRSRHNIRYIPSLSGKYEMIPGMEYDYFLVVLSKAFYFQLIDEDSSLHSAFVDEIKNGKYTSLSAKDHIVSHEMVQVINDIRDCRKTGELKRLYTESKILELLMLQLEQQQLENADNAEPVMKTDELKKIEQAREILDSNFCNPPIIPELSRMVGLNDFKLKRGFKAYYGTTIYGYSTRLRMEYARKLLVEDRKNIAEVTYEVGFKHQSHLSEAFKNYFGILPSEVRR